MLAIVGIVVAVAILTELRPGRKAARSLAAAPLAAAQPPTLPPRDAVVDARELGSLAVAVARTPRRATVTIIGPDATGVDGRDVRVERRDRGAVRHRLLPRAAARAARSACRSAAARSTFDVAGDARPTRRRRSAAITRAYRASRTIVFDETLASSPDERDRRRASRSSLRNRLSYADRSGGPARS